MSAPKNGHPLDENGRVFDDASAPPPEVPQVPLDEEPRQQPPGSFLSALPQFFVFPAILVATLTAVYLLLRVLAGSGDESVPELLADLEAAGPHGRWQVLQTLATGLQQGRLDLDEVSSEELLALYERYRDVAETPLERARMQQYLLGIVAAKRDPVFTPLALEALESSDESLRQHALRALGLLADPAALPALEQRLAGEDRDERLLALGALANIDDDRSRELLAGSLRSEDSILARNAALLLVREPHRDARAKPFLIHMLSREGYAKDPSLDGELRDLMDEDSREAARADAVETFLVMACLAASELGDPAAVPPLQVLRETDPSLKVRSAAIDALHALGSS